MLDLLTKIDDDDDDDEKNTSRLQNTLLQRCLRVLYSENNSNQQVISLTNILDKMITQNGEQKPICVYIGHGLQVALSITKSIFSAMAQKSVFL